MKGGRAGGVGPASRQRNGGHAVGERETTAGRRGVV